MKKNKKGIVIITTMLLLSIVIMIAALLVVTGRSTLLLGASYSDREQAYYAAECGLAYAQHCISKYKDWVAADTTLDSLYDPGFNDFTVSMAGTQSNCVRGILHGNGSEFYITFYSGTWNDASSLRKDIDHNGNLGTPLKYYSVNNLSNDSNDGYSKYLNEEGKGKTFRDVPKNSAHIIVEGRCNQVRRYAEAILQKLDVKTGSACSVAAGGVEVDLKDNNSVFLVDAASGYDSKIRSMSDIKVTSSANDKNCYHISNGGSSCTGAGTESSPTSKYTYVNNTKIDNKDEQTEYGISCENKPQSEYLEKAKLKWDDVTKKYLSGSTFDASTVKTTVKAGTYVYMNSSDLPDTYKLYYYPPSVTYDPDADKNDNSNPANFVEKNSASREEYSTALVASSRSGDLAILETVTKAQLEAGNTYLFTAANPIGIAPDGTDGSLAVAVYDYGTNNKYAPSTKYRASVKLSGTEDQDPCLISQSGGNIYVAGELSGKGKILSGGAIDFQGRSLLEADATSSTGVSIYAQGSVNVNPVVGTGGASDPNTDIKEAWDALITNNSYSASGSYNNTGLTDYSDLQALLLDTKIDDVNGLPTKLSDVLKNDYNYDKATIEEMINTLMSKNTYIGSDTSTTSETTTIGTGTVATMTYGGKDYVVTTTMASSNYYISIQQSDKTTITDSKIQFIYNSSGVLSTGTGLLANGLDHSSLSGKVTFSSGTWTVTGETNTNNQSSDTIMMHNTSTGFVNLSSTDTILKGLIYTWKDFRAKDLAGGSLSIRGGIVAYGGDPSSQDPGTNGYGKISISKGKYVTFTYDPDYMKLIFDISNGFATKRIMQNAY